MVNINFVDDYFEYIKNNVVKKIVYGVGKVTKRNYTSFGEIDYFCDKNALVLNSFQNIKCILPHELEKFQSHLAILVCVAEEQVFNQICAELEILNIDAEVFYLFNNPSFRCFHGWHPVDNQTMKEKLKIRLVYNQDGWILGKFASKLEEELTKMGQDVSVSDSVDINADVNHYIFYGDLLQFSELYKGVITTMITHVDSGDKKNLISFQTQNDALGICMSKDTMEKLTRWGIDREKLCYVNPAQDSQIKPKKIVLGITNRCYAKEDFRKNDLLIVDVCKQLDPDFFEFKIMGSGWEEIVRELEQMGFEVTYYNDFDSDIYLNMMPSLDYWIYYGFDEGAMGYLDAMAAGIKTIVTPQGYHLDTFVKPTYLCSTVNDFVQVLKQIQDEKKKIVNAVADWTWENYAKKHLEIWQYLTKTKTLRELYKQQGKYMDGFFSMLIENNNV